jgi:hypothetical protein
MITSNEQLRTSNDGLMKTSQATLKKAEDKDADYEEAKRDLDSAQ